VRDLTVSGLLRELWLVWLVLLFVGIVVWVMWPGRRRKLESHARIPLDDDDPKPGPGRSTPEA
jgi:cytochrome c oxidase cbb3-type subunit 4